MLEKEIKYARRLLRTLTKNPDTQAKDYVAIMEQIRKLVLTEQSLEKEKDKDGLVFELPKELQDAEDSL